MLRITSPLKFSLFALIIIAIIFAITAKIMWGTAKIQTNGEIVIAQGESAQSIWKDAVQSNFTPKTLPWRYYTWRLQAGDKIQAGTYTIDKNETVADVIKRFISGDTIPDELTVTYPEGFTLQQIAERTEKQGIGTASNFIESAKPGKHSEVFGFLSNIPAERDLEGYLFPDTYRVFPDDTESDVIKRLIGNLSERLAALNIDPNSQAISVRNQPRTLDEVIIMASIIEREVQIDKDMALVSGVLWKRLDENIGLAVDATIRYALDKPTAPLTAQDLAVDSPYNTRKYAGLPPGPIANPGLRAIQAALNPEESPYYYYLNASGTGETIFGRTNDEHNANKAKYLR